MSDKVCPHCGYCKHCGRPSRPWFPYQPWPYYPYYWSDEPNTFTVKNDDITANTSPSLGEVKTFLG